MHLYNYRKDYTMVKAELAYNPYTLETEIKFNGQPPRINSLVEKYQSSILQDWIKDLPYIFHDEMNGYDFELEFSGTLRDFDELKRAFKQAGVTDDDVKLFHKSELEDRDCKRLRIKELLKWLEDNPNRNFDNDQFRKDNEILFDGAYSVVSIQGKEADKPIIEWAPVSIEIIKDCHELDNTDLTCTPIVINVDEEIIPKLQYILRYLFGRQDVVVQQIFFRIRDTLNRDIVNRMIKDLGIKNPHTVKSFDDDNLKKYFEIYPVTDYIVDSIDMFTKESEKVYSVIEREKEQGKKTNTAIDEQIQLKEEELQRLHETEEAISTKINIDKPAAFTNAKNLLNNKISAWRKKKTKSTQKDEAEKLCDELMAELVKNADDFMGTVEFAVAGIKQMIDTRLSDAYKTSGSEDGFSAEKVELRDTELIVIPEFKDKLMGLHVEEQVRKGNVGLFYIPSKNSEDDYEMQTAYYLQTWREHIFAILEPLTDEYMNDRLDALAEYNNQASKAYRDHLIQVIDSKIKEEEALSQQLSSEKKQLQQDGAWLNEYKQQLKQIARG